MAWRSLGRVYEPERLCDSMRTHAAMPTPVHVEGDVFRVYFSARDEANRSSTASLLLNVSETPRVERVEKTPVLSPGAAGCFDDAGLNASCIVRQDGSAPDLLYYMGWNLDGDAPWRNSIGLAVGDALTGEFERASSAPVLGIGSFDALSMSYPWVMASPAGGFRMWYGTNLHWGDGTSEQPYRFVFRTATSDDGRAWNRREEPVMAPEGDETGLSRPCVIALPEGGWRMWFCPRSPGGYRLNSAYSNDCVSWVREGATPGLAPTGEGWASQSLAYPCAFEHAGRLWMLFNGDGYGATGFGLAVWDA